MTPEQMADQSCYCLNCEALGKELAALKAAPPQEPDRLHIAVMNLARKQADRIEELEAKLARGTPPPAQPLTEEQERKAFEGWVGRLMFCSESDLVHHALTGYGDLQLNSMWVGWRGQKIYTPPATPAEALAAVEAGVSSEAQPAEPAARHTEDHLTDRSATTYNKEMVYRWQCKGWPATPLFYAPAPAQQPPEAKQPDQGVKGYAMALNEVALKIRHRYRTDMLSTPLWAEFEKARNKLATSIAAPAQQPLTKAQIKALIVATPEPDDGDVGKWVLSLIRAVEKAHKIGSRP